MLATGSPVTKTIVKPPHSRVRTAQSVYRKDDILGLQKHAAKIEPSSSYIIQPEIFNLATYPANWNLN